MFIVATNVAASRPPERQLTGMPTVRANYSALKFSESFRYRQDKNDRNYNIPIRRVKLCRWTVE